MPLFNAKVLNTQNDLLMQNLTEFYKNPVHMQQFLSVVQTDPRGSDHATPVSLRIIDWFVTNYAKKYYTVYEIVSEVDPERDTMQFVSTELRDPIRFKVYNDYKLKLKAYSKRRFDPFCRWERIQIPYDESENGTEAQYIETTIGQLNFFKWAIENHILGYIQRHYHVIEHDMNTRNTTSKRRNGTETSTDSTDSSLSVSSHTGDDTIPPCHGHSVTEKRHVSDNSPVECTKTRKKREELSISACKCIRKETVKILVKFS